MNFQEYLHKKKIDSESFKKAEPEQWRAWESVFNEVHPDSFTAQKLYLINPVRRLYPYSGEPEAVIQKEKPKKPMIRTKAAPVSEDMGNKPAKPVMKAKPKMPVKPKVPLKPKVSTAPTDELAKEVEEQKGQEEPKTSKPKIKPRPVIKRPKKD